MKTIEELLESTAAQVERLRSRAELNVNMDAKAALVRAADVLPHGRLVVSALRGSLEGLSETLAKLEKLSAEPPKLPDEVA